MLCLPAFAITHKVFDFDSLIFWIQIYLKVKDFKWPHLFINLKVTHRLSAKHFQSLSTNSFRFCSVTSKHLCWLVVIVHHSRTKLDSATDFHLDNSNSMDFCKKYLQAFSDYFCCFWKSVHFFFWICSHFLSPWLHSLKRIRSLLFHSKCSLSVFPRSSFGNLLSNLSFIRSFLFI